MRNRSDPSPVSARGLQHQTDSRREAGMVVWGRRPVLAVLAGAMDEAAGACAAAVPILTVGPSTATPRYRDSCITSAIGTAALKAGVDAIGLLPEAGGVARIIGHQAGYVGVVADRFGANILGAVGHTGTAVDGLVNAGNTTPQGLLSTGLTIAGFIPGASDVAAVLSISLDVISTIQAVGACP